MHWDLGLQGVALLLAMSLGFGLLAWLVAGRNRTTTGWMWLIAAGTFFVAGLLTSEVWFGWATEEELQPNIDGLSFDETLLFGLLAGVAAVLVTRHVSRRRHRQDPKQTGPHATNLAVSEDRDGRAASTRRRRARLQPRWFVVVFWHSHRALVRGTRGRLGLWRPKPGGWGALRLTTTGRRTGQPRQVLVGYFEDGPNLITMAMNGWGAAEPAWWLNLQAHPDATVQTRDGLRPVRARCAQGIERERLWSRWRDIDTNLEAYAALRPTETAVVVLEPCDGAETAAEPVSTDSAAASPGGRAR